MSSQKRSYESVLDYWFGGDQQLNYKTKWFPSTNTADNQQQTTDIEINSIFYTLFNDIINTRSDFDSNSCIGIHKHEWLLSSESLESSGNYRSQLAYILVLDQFSRHIYRLQEVSKEDQRRQSADKLAVEATDQLIQYNQYWWHHYSSTEIIFALMPYRHSPTIARLEYISTILDLKEARDKEGLELMNKFRKQTITRLQRLNDRQKVRKSSI